MCVGDLGLCKIQQHIHRRVWPATVGARTVGYFLIVNRMALGIMTQAQYPRHLMKAGSVFCHIVKVQGGYGRSRQKHSARCGWVRV
jgi:hypothetical protein